MWLHDSWILKDVKGIQSFQIIPNV
jgi:hypothetical protein